ncbi:hypothetical protein [Streptomyces sp. SLBN-118]|uniref:hypothetical protein n=1 Tax=Streptomyces sp. SLBN-118 TaxID=2768454 RepID=UPI0021B45FCA|nr:hypothetical protein [Streptomyces sp. SLBN-118]
MSEPTSSSTATPTCTSALLRTWSCTGVPEAAATVLCTARELLRQSYYCYEFSTVAVMHSLIAVEIVLRDRIPGAGKKPRQRLIEQVPTRAS